MAVDVCVGIKGIGIIADAGHHVVVEAEPGEQDRDWFTRALVAGAEVVIAADSDLEILCYDHRIAFFRARPSERGRVTAERFVKRYARRAA